MGSLNVPGFSPRAKSALDSSACMGSGTAHGSSVKPCTKGHEVEGDGMCFGESPLGNGEGRGLPGRPALVSHLYQNLQKIMGDSGVVLKIVQISLPDSE